MKTPPNTAAISKSQEICMLLQTDFNVGFDLLYTTFAHRIHALWVRSLGPRDAEDAVHDILLVAAYGIQAQKLRVPEALSSYLRTIAMRTIGQGIGRQIKERNRVELEAVQVAALSRPDLEIEEAERLQILKKRLFELKERDRRIITRFYLDGASKETICQELSLTETQFRLSKSRAKASLTAPVRKPVPRFVAAQAA